jgi:hypothetical protein
MKMDENWWKKIVSTSVSIFFIVKGSGSENADSETEYVGVWKRTNKVRNSTKMVGSQELKLEYCTSLYSQFTKLGPHT